MTDNDILDQKKSQSFDTNVIATQVIEQLYQLDDEGRLKREQLKSSQQLFLDNLRKATQINSSNKDSGSGKITIGNSIPELQFAHIKTFFNHKYQFQEVMRSQHIYKVLHELKYTQYKNVKTYADLVEEGIEEVLKLDSDAPGICSALIKRTEHQINKLNYMRNELQREYFGLFSSNVNEYGAKQGRITSLIQNIEHALIEQEDFKRNLKAEIFYQSNAEYQKQHLPDFSINAGANIIIENTQPKFLQNFSYVTEGYIREYFNSFTNQHLCARKIKKIRLINDILPIKIQLLCVIKYQQLNSEYWDIMTQQLQQQYYIRTSYKLASSLLEIQGMVGLKALKLGIKENIQVDNGCLLLYAVDKRFEDLVQEQSEIYMQFHPYNLSSPFMQTKEKQNCKGQAEQVLNIMEKERKQKKQIKIRSCAAWLDKIQLLQQKDNNQIEQDFVLEQYEDTFIKSWLHFLLFTEQTQIQIKLEKDISVIKERINNMFSSQQQVPLAYIEFYRRLLKLLFMNSRNSIIKIMSYLNFYRCLQKNVNLHFVEVIQGQNLEGQTYEVEKSMGVAPTQPLHKQMEAYQKGVQDDKFFLTNPSIAQYGNLTNFQFKQAGNQINQTNSNVVGGGVGPTTQGSNEDYIKDLKGEAKVLEEPNMLYEEEHIEIIDELVHITDHNDMNIAYDSSVQDFLELMKKIGQICALYFHFNQKHEQKGTDNSTTVFQDYYDRESLVESVLFMEQQFYLAKTHLLMKMQEVMRNCFNPDLKNQLILLIAQIVARRPQISLFENKIFECYKNEIENLQILTQIIITLMDDLWSEEEKLFILKHQNTLKKQQYQATSALKDNNDNAVRKGQDGNKIGISKLENLELQLKSYQGKRFFLFMGSLVKLILNIERQRKHFTQLILSGKCSGKNSYFEISRCENEYFKELLTYSKKVVFDAGGVNIFPDYLDYAKILENNAILDKFESFDVLQQYMHSFLTERYTQVERERFDFDAFSIIEFIKVRQKFINFLYVMSFATEIYRQQVIVFGEEFRDKFENAADPTQTIVTIPGTQKSSTSNNINTQVSEGRGMNYLKILLDLDQVKLSKEILQMDDWSNVILHKEKIIEFLIPLQALIVTQQMTLNSIIINNLYFYAMQHAFPNNQHFEEKLSFNASSYFRNIFDIKRQNSIKAVDTMRQQEMNRKYQQDQQKQQLQQQQQSQENQEQQQQERKSQGKTSGKQSQGKIVTGLGIRMTLKGLKRFGKFTTSRNMAIPEYSSQLKRENQYDALKIHTILQRNYLQRLAEKLPFDQHGFQFDGLSIPPKLKQGSSQNSKQHGNSNKKKQYTHEKGTNAQKGVHHQQVDDDLNAILGNEGSQQDDSNKFLEDFFFDQFGNAIYIYNLPSIEQLLALPHEDFRTILIKYKIIKTDFLNPDDEEEDVFLLEEDEHMAWLKDHESGGKQWFVQQQEKIEKGQCLWLPNKNLSLSAGALQIKGYKYREVFSKRELFYLKKTQLFVVWKILGSVINIFSLQIFLSSLDANNIDIIYFHNGLLGSSNLRLIIPDHNNTNKQQQNSRDATTQGKLQHHSIQERRQSNNSNSVHVNPNNQSVNAPFNNTNSNSKMASNSISDNQGDPFSRVSLHHGEGEDEAKNGESINEGKTNNNKQAFQPSEMQVSEFKRSELRLRRDFESFVAMKDNINQNIFALKNNQRIVNTNEAIISYLEKKENRLFLTILHLLFEQINKSRNNEDFEYMHRMRNMLIQLNFPQIKHMYRYFKEGGHILLSQLATDVKEKLSSVEQEAALAAKQLFGSASSSDVLATTHSDLMNMIRTVFWDKRPIVYENVHSTNINLNPLRYFFEENMKFCSVLDKSLIGLKQSKVTELSTTFTGIKQQVSTFLRKYFVFEKDDVYKYERMYTKYVNICMRMNIVREIFYVRHFKVFPFEIVNEARDPLQEKLVLFQKYLMEQEQINQALQRKNNQNQSIKTSASEQSNNSNNIKQTLSASKPSQTSELISPLQRRQSQLLINNKGKQPKQQQKSIDNKDPNSEIVNLYQGQQQSQQKNNKQQKNQDDMQDLALMSEVDILLRMHVYAFELSKILLEEANDFYHKANMELSSWMQTNQIGVGGGGISRIFYNEQQLDVNPSQNELQIQRHQAGGYGGYYDPLRLVKTFNRNKEVEFDMISLLSNFSYKLYMDSVEIKTLGKNHALVVFKENIIQHLYEHNLELLELLDKKYSNTIQKLEQKNQIMENDVLFLKKENALKEKKISFLENNIQSIVEALVAQRTTELSFECQTLKKQLTQLEQEESVRQHKLKEQVREEFKNEITDNNLNVIKQKIRYDDFTRGINIDVQNFIDNVRDDNFKKIKEWLQGALQDYGGSQFGVHSINAMINASQQKKQEKLEQMVEKKQQQQIASGQQQQSQPGQQQSGGTQGTTIGNTNNINVNATIQQNAQQITTKNMVTGGIIEGQAGGEQQLNLEQQQKNQLMKQLMEQLGEENEDLLQLDIFQRIAVQNKQVFQLLKDFQRLRFFNIMKHSCIVQKYEEKIKKIQEFNSSNEELYKKIAELQKQCDELKAEDIISKKIINVMENQNEILRRDVERTRKERMKILYEEKKREQQLMENLDTQQSKDSTLLTKSHSSLMQKKIQIKSSSTQFVTNTSSGGGAGGPGVLGSSGLNFGIQTNSSPQQQQANNIVNIANKGGGFSNTMKSSNSYSKDFFLPQQSITSSQQQKVNQAVLNEYVSQSRPQTANQRSLKLKNKSKLLEQQQQQQQQQPYQWSQLSLNQQPRSASSINNFNTKDKSKPLQITYKVEPMPSIYGDLQ